VIVSDRNHNLFEHRFSPDQRWISFIAVNASDAGVSTIHTTPAAGGRWQAVTDGSTYDDKPHWSPDGRILYFVSHRDGVLNVWGRRIDTATGMAIGPIFQVTSFNSPRQMISPQPLPDAHRPDREPSVPADHRHAERALDARERG
jgi:Tol biopolymer transport system component